MSPWFSQVGLTLCYVTKSGYITLYLITIWAEWVISGMLMFIHV